MQFQKLQKMSIESSEPPMEKMNRTNSAKSLGANSPKTGRAILEHFEQIREPLFETEKTKALNKLIGRLHFPNFQKEKHFPSLNLPIKSYA